ncbi:MAG TPA: DUF6600 domain-containing protein [Bacteroidota bacterium]|nr:DUF6600 domain-containing protein [Bacteroidota bacterium]
MKTIMALGVLLILASAPALSQEDADMGMFYSSLGSEGEWIPVDGGNYVWHPAGVDPDWRPYTDGHWVWTDDGWYWASEEPWAWATYHYGRWYFDDTYGWVWMPGYEWAPAWVEWRYGDDCIGWAPLSPYAVFSVNWGVHYRRYWATPYYYWSFVDCRYMGYGDIHRYIYRTSDNTRFIGRTRTAGSVRYDGGRIVTRGPERGYVEQRGGVSIPRASLVDVRERGEAGVMREPGGERIGVYRPRIEAGSRAVPAVRPDRVRAEDHPMNFDMRGTDIRRTEEARAPRENVMPPVERQAPAARPNYQSRELSRPAARPAVEERPRQERRNEGATNAPRNNGWSRPGRTFTPPARSGGGHVEAPAHERSGGGGHGGRR